MRYASAIPANLTVNDRGNSTEFFPGGYDALASPEILTFNVSGNSTVKIAPPPGRLSALNRAPCAWAIPAEIASPSPDPRALVVKNGSKTRSVSSGGIPGPLSDTVTVTCVSVRFTSTMTVPQLGV